MPNSLTAGDLALVGFSSDTGGKSFAFVTLKDLPAGTVIYFTDNGWLAAGGFRAGEGVYTYTVPVGGLSAGAVITISGLTGAFNPSTSGDQIIAYQSDGTTITPIYGLDFADSNTSWAADASNSNTSAVPSGLVSGSTALAFGTDNGAYTGPTTGTPAQILANIANPANWTLHDANLPTYASGFTVDQSSGAASVSIGDVSVSEGDNGVTLMTFTVTRSAPGGDFTVGYATADGTATAGTDYTAVSGSLHFTAAGPDSQTVTVQISGDTAAEPNESLLLNLTNVVNTSGTATLLDGQAVGTIVNDDFAHLAIGQIQGEGHTSAYEGQRVITSGVVTAIDTTGGRGFWIQDPDGDGNDATSDAVFVFTNAPVTVTVGQLVQVDATVSEFRGSDPNNLTVTELTAPSITVIGTGTVEATVIGEGGRHAPTEVIDSDHLGTFNPDHDGIDFYESLEGMLVTVHDAVAVDVNQGNSVWVLPDAGAGATGVNDRGGITISESDFNPEHLQLFFDSGVLAGVTPNYAMGEHIGDVTGIMHYFGGQYELLPTAIESAGTAPALPEEVTGLQGDRAHLEVAAYNVENLDLADGQAKFDALGHDIAVNLGSPDIIGLEEIQDADGPGNGTNYSGAVVAQALIDAIVAAGGPRYVYVEIAPTANNSTGGEGNGNIRNGFLYNPERVDYVEGSAFQIADTDPARGDAFNNSRMPLVGQFVFHGEVVTAISVHNYSRGGSQELFGATQPPVDSGVDRRADQVAAISTYLHDLAQTDPNAHVVVMGDFNGFYFEQAQTQLETDAGLFNLTRTLTAEERYSYVFEGNAQQIDHMFVSPNLTDDALFDIVHLNTGQPGGQITDHDPILGLLFVNSAPDVAADVYYGTEEGSISANAFSGVLSNDTDHNDDAFLASLLAGPDHGVLDFHADGSFTYTPEADFSGVDGFLYVAVDEFGTASDAVLVSLNVTAAEDAPVAAPDSASVQEDHTVSIDVLANDHDPDGDALTIQLLSDHSDLGASISVQDGQVVYTADADAFDSLAPGASVVDTLSYRVSDGHGGWSDPVTVSVTVHEAGDARTVTPAAGTTSFTDAPGFDTTYNGGSRNETVHGMDGADTLNGGVGNDTLYGDDGTDHLTGAIGNDALHGGAGDDVLEGGAGDDIYWGDAGHDTFIIGAGRDTIMDYDPDQDTIIANGPRGGRGYTYTDIDTNNDHVNDAVLVQGPGAGQLVLAGWSVATLAGHEPFGGSNAIAKDSIGSKGGGALLPPTAADHGLFAAHGLGLDGGFAGDPHGAAHDWVF